MNAVFIKAKKVNLISFLLIIPISLIVIIPFWTKWAEQSHISIRQIKITLSLFNSEIINSIIIILSPMVLITIGIVVHELIHGLFMLIFSKKIKSIKFGFRKDVGVFYAHCKVPLISIQMLIISLAPWVILGLIPYSISIINGDIILWFIGFSMTLASVGDFMYAFLILKTGLNVIIKDHGSEVGFIIVK